MLSSTEPEEVKKLRDKFAKIADISDPLHREYEFALLEQEAKQYGISMESYRRLFEVYLRDKEHIPDQPKKWGVPDWANWFISLPPKTKVALLRKGFFIALEKGVLITVAAALVRYFWEAPKREKQAHYQAWQMINSAQGQQGSGGRIEALQDLNKDGVSLNGLSAKNANLEDINLEKAQLFAANLQGANLKDANLQKAYLRRTNLHLAILYRANLEGASLREANLREAHLREANLEGANLEGASLDGAYLWGANLKGANLKRVDLTLEQVKSTQNWQLAHYDPNFRKQLGLPPETPRGNKGKF